MQSDDNFPPYKVISIDKLVPYARNSRTHSPEQIDQIAASIREFGFTNPLLIDPDGGIIAGHCRLLAAHKLGFKEAPVIELGYLSEAQKRAYVIADNKLALNAGWDEDSLRIEFQDLAAADFDLDLTGFAYIEIAEIKGEVDFAPGSEDDQGKLDELEPKYCICPDCGSEFDLRQNV